MPELLAVTSQKSAEAADQASVCLREMACNEVEFAFAVGSLRNYSLAEEMEDRTGHWTHPVVHQGVLDVKVYSPVGKRRTKGY